MPNKIDLSGRFAAVTGGAQGIGKAIVERFLDSGASVAIWDRDKAFAEKTAKELSNRGKVIAVAVDVTDIKDVERARDDTVKAFGRIDILVNNAGIAGMNATTWDYPVDEWSKVMRVNLDGPFHCCRALAPLMIAQNIRPHRQHRLDRRQGRQPERLGLFGLEGGRRRADQIARQGARRLRHRGELHHAGRGEDRDLRPDEAGAHRLHALEDPARAFRQGRGDRGARGVVRLGRQFLHHRRGVRHFRRAGDVLSPAEQARHDRLTGIGLMCGAVVLFACNDAVAKYLNNHMPTVQVVWARYMAAFVLALFMSNPIMRPSIMRTSRPWLQLGRSTLAARLHRAQLLRAALSAARSGDRDHLLHAVHRGGARRPDPRRMDQVAALDRDHGRLLRRAAGHAAGRGRHPPGGAALVRRSDLLCDLLDLDAHSLALGQQRDHQLLFQPGGRGPGHHRGAVHLDAAKRSDSSSC